MLKGLSKFLTNGTECLYNFRTDFVITRIIAILGTQDCILPEPDFESGKKPNKLHLKLVIHLLKLKEQNQCCLKNTIVHIST